MSRKRILIVDDDKDILFLLTLSVKNLGPDYEVTTAMSGADALDRIQKHTFDLVITDRMMPGMSGLQLVQEVRRISPDTQVVLMTAYDTALARRQIEDMELDGYVGKPFTVSEILEVIERVVAQTQETDEEDRASTPETDQAISEHLQILRAKTGAHYVLLISSDGHPLYIDGQVARAKAARVAAFVAANFLAVTEMAHLLEDNESVFNAIYHEGSKYNIYACGVKDNFLLVVVFGTAGKPGTVWFYAKQTATALEPYLNSDSEIALGGDVSKNLPADFDNLLGSDDV